MITTDVLRTTDSSSTACEPELQAQIFDVEYYGTKDGPGIRTVLFFKGCDLSCRWCHNPESQHAAVQLMYHGDHCIGCGRCIDECPSHALSIDSERGVVTDPGLCTLCGRCASVCAFGARTLIGERMSLEQVKRIISKDLEFFRESNGGVTITGGEPMLQRAFLQQLLPWLNEQRIHTAIETAGAYPLHWLTALIDAIDMVFIDFKHIDRQRHLDMTGSSNEASLEALEYLVREHAQKTIVRIPVIPGFNHDRQSMDRMFSHLQRIGCTSTIELLPYHNLGNSKYRSLAMDNEFSGHPSLNEQQLLPWKELGTAFGLTIRIGAV